MTRVIASEKNSAGTQQKSENPAKTQVCGFALLRGLLSKIPVEGLNRMTVLAAIERLRQAGYHFEVHGSTIRYRRVRKTGGMQAGEARFLLALLKAYKPVALEYLRWPEWRFQPGGVGEGVPH